LSPEGVWRILEEHEDAGVLSRSITRRDVDEVVRQELVQEAWWRCLRSTTPNAILSDCNRWSSAWDI